MRLIASSSDDSDLSEEHHHQRVLGPAGGGGGGAPQQQQLRDLRERIEGSGLLAALEALVAADYPLRQRALEQLAGQTQQAQQQGAQQQQQQAAGSGGGQPTQLGASRGLAGEFGKNVQQKVRETERRQHACMLLGSLETR